MSRQISRHISTVGTLVSWSNRLSSLYSQAIPSLEQVTGDSRRSLWEAPEVEMISKLMMEQIIKNSMVMSWSLHSEMLLETNCECIEKMSVNTEIIKMLIAVNWVPKIRIHNKWRGQKYKILSSVYSKENVQESYKYWLHLSWLSYCETKYDNQNKETKHLLKLFGYDM